MRTYAQCQLIHLFNTFNLKYESKCRDDVQFFMDAHNKCVDMNPKSNGEMSDVAASAELETTIAANSFTSAQPLAYRAKGNVYVRHIKQYENIVNAVRTPEQEQRLTEELDKLFETMLSMEADKNRSVASATTIISESGNEREDGQRGIASLNVVNHSSHYSRQKPTGSPSRFKR